MSSGASSETSGTEGDWRERFESLVERQAALYGALDALSQRQTEMVGAGDAEGVLEILRQRQRIIEELVIVTERTRPYRDRWTQAGPGVEPGVGDRIARRIVAIERLAAEISGRDEGDRERLAERRERVAAELADVGRARRAVHAYGGSNGGGASFQDREG